MVYYGRRRYRRRNYRRGRRNVQKRRIKNLIARSQEIKYITTKIDTGASTAPSTTIPLTQIAQADGSSERDGSYIKLKNIILQYSVSLADSVNTVRTILFQWKQYTTPSVTDILYTTAPFNTSTWLAPYNKATEKSYKILYDRTRGLDSVLAVQVTQRIRLNMRRVTKELHYQNTAGTSPCYNSIWMIVIGDSGATPHPSVVGYVSLRYTDS